MLPSVFKAAPADSRAASRRLPCAVDHEGNEDRHADEAARQTLETVPEVHGEDGGESEIFSDAPASNGKIQLLVMDWMRWRLTKPSRYLPQFELGPGEHCRNDGRDLQRDEGMLVT
ncbi:hypothetical protein MesoLjLc_38560 [Mesorhizobium sp. L-8-10]|uniref:hypothetical protein n=1 Tax=unclassified Mesorhizobium TaxID=325217 RepID=UPI001928BC6F|nr:MULTISPECIES: hypothetical protein [unclassified Mesorhizobium]BCH24193.1 hypothetical protein MesoLjLb_39780 [Mesorhizobium sp. L-8-3]BCH31926.1 hypothetical protein MesoLjLc_38560 [Mesorhizobium sp. L-8-10]